MGGGGGWKCIAGGGGYRALELLVFKITFVSLEVGLKKQKQQIALMQSPQQPQHIKNTLQERIRQFKSKVIL
jgi:hypothetical protein